MKDYANSRLKLKRTVIWAFCLHKFGWYLKVKVGFLKAKTLFTEGKGFFAFFSEQAMFDPWSLVDHRRDDSTPHSSRQLWARTSNSDRLIPHWPRERRSKNLSSAPFWGEYLENLHAHRKLHALKSNLGKKTKHCPDPTGRGANDTNHANADINISYFMGLNHLRSLICTYSARDLRPLMEAIT